MQVIIEQFPKSSFSVGIISDFIFFSVHSVISKPVIVLTFSISSQAGMIVINFIFLACENGFWRYI